MKILVFCQRKQSFDKKDDYKVKNVVEQIERFIKQHYDNDCIIEYLTSGNYGVSEHLYDAEYKMFFDINSKDEMVKNKTFTFINENREIYDMILLQTCPLLLLKNQLPHLFKTLKPNGILLFSKFSYDTMNQTENKQDKQNEESILTENEVNIFVKDILESMFIKTENNNYTEYIKI